MIKIEQVGALLHNLIHVGNVNKPQLQRRYERVANDARKTNINSVFGGGQVALIVLYIILCGISKLKLACYIILCGACKIKLACEQCLDLKAESGCSSSARKLGVQERHANHIDVVWNCRQHVTVLASTLREVSQALQSFCVRCHKIEVLACECVACVWHPCDVVGVSVRCSG